MMEDLFRDYVLHAKGGVRETTVTDGLGDELNICCQFIVNSVTGTPSKMVEFP